jgi:para-nitrobenzyl esterase
VGAASLDALRAMPAADLLKMGQWNWRPVIDGYVLPEPIGEIFRGEKSNPVTLLTGWNEDEGIVVGPKSAADYKQDVAKQYGADADAVLRLYPADNDSIARVSQIRLSRDLIFGRENYTWAVMASGLGEKVFVYRFVRKPPTAPGGQLWGAFHTAEVPYAYDNLRFVKRPFEPVDYSLADAMSSYWVNFAKAGDPNGVGLARWEPFERESGKIIVFGQQPAAGVLPDKAALEWWYNRMIKN